MNPKDFPIRPATPQSINMRRPAYGIGINDADYVVCPSIDGKQVFCPYYQDWMSMLKRVTGDRHSATHVAPEWRTFSNFKLWVDQQPEVRWWEMDLDKDIINPSNKTYGPHTCCYVPTWLNNIIKEPIDRGWSPQAGEGRRKPYRVRVRTPEGQKQVGYFASEGEARVAYLNARAGVLENLAYEGSDHRVRAGLRLHAELLRKEAHRSGSLTY